MFVLYRRTQPSTEGANDHIAFARTPPSLHTSLDAQPPINSFYSDIAPSLDFAFALAPLLTDQLSNSKMNISTILLVLALYLRVSAFVPAVKKARATHLNYNIVMPPQDDETENEESFFARKKKEKAEEESLFRERCEGEGLNLSEIDRVETVDMYNNPMGSLIPGVHLTSMCGDD